MDPKHEMQTLSAATCGGSTGRKSVDAFQRLTGGHTDGGKAVDHTARDTSGGEGMVLCIFSDPTVAVGGASSN